MIRCVCGLEDDDDGGRMMICCDNCSAWQHNDCMEVTEDEDELPESYMCEVCKPEDHKGLLEAMARGEKPWEALAKRRAEGKKGRKRRGGKRGRQSKQSQVEEQSSTIQVTEDSYNTQDQVPLRQTKEINNGESMVG